MGDHAAVYGRPALVAAVDLRLRAIFSAGRRAGGVELDLSDLFDPSDSPAPGAGRPGPLAELRSAAARGYLATVNWDEVLAYALQARQSWVEYAAHPDPEGFSRLRGGDPAHLVKVALGEAAAALAEPGAPPDLRLRLDSSLPIGSGFGSSAAAAVAVIGGYFIWRRAGRRPGPDGPDGLRAPLSDGDAARIESLALEAERRQHGLPSGIDTATVLHGGLLWAERRPGGALACARVAPSAAGADLLGRLRVYHTGTPAEPTGAVVAAVRARHDRDPAGHERVFDRMAAAAHALRAEIEGGEPAPPARTPQPDLPDLPDPIVELLREYQSCMERLGVIPQPVRDLVRLVEAAGGAAKVSGAGSLAGPGAGSLLVYHPDPGQIAGWDFLRPLPFYPVELGAAGFRSERHHD